MGIGEKGVTARVVAAHDDHEAVNSDHCFGRLPMPSGTNVTAISSAGDHQPKTDRGSLARSGR